jgi:putative ribosome biogenesis GTPase RsgA
MAAKGAGGRVASKAAARKQASKKTVASKKVSAKAAAKAVAAKAVADKLRRELVILTGMSGAGKASALKTFDRCTRRHSAGALSSDPEEGPQGPEYAGAVPRSQ